MSDWNPSLYLHFAAERSRPAVELLARVPLENIKYVADLGCGPGNSTALLHQRWPAARITGIDSSPAMIAEARSALPDCQFVEADIRNWQPEQALDLIFANASLQWLPDHYELFPHLVSLLNPQGVLAVQMPDNWLEPTHVLMREVAWEQNYPDRGREPLAGVHAYYDILSEAGCEVDIWRTTYYHQMPSHQAIIDWVTATGLRPWLQDLIESEQQLFLKRYHQMLEEQVSTARERTDTAGISASFYCCPAYGVNITSAGNDDREEFLLEFRLHRSSVTGQFQ